MAGGGRPWDGAGRESDAQHPGHAGQAGPLRFGVLGPVRVHRGGEPLDVGSPQRRALLAALLLRRGRTVTAPELIDDLWGAQPPDAAVAALRNHASRLRKAFGPDADVLASESGGYAMRIAADAVDLGQAEELRTLADRASAAGDQLGARELLQRALDLWDGETLAGVPGPYADSQRNRLEEWRVGLLESRLELDLTTGHPADCIAELTALTVAHPLRERLRELLMLALYRCGRQAEALAVYADTRRLLADELGVDPRAELSALQQRILRGDPALNPPVDGQGAARREVVVRPAQLPAAVADFTGRTRLAAELVNHLAPDEGPTMAVAAVAGIGGVGKTTLAVHVAHAARHHFPDGQLYVDLQGAGPGPAEPEVVLGAFLRALGVPYEAIPPGVQERAALYRSTLAGRRVLTLLDNARDAGQVRPLLPGAEGCAALVTSRAHLALDGALVVDLDVTTPAESHTLFARIVGPERIGDDHQAASAVVAACGYLPLAIRIAASRLATRRRWSVATLATKLADERNRLDELRVGDLAVTACFEVGYAQLDTAQARAFCLLGLPHTPDISLPAAAALLDLPSQEAEGIIESLVDASLLEATTPDRYRFHDLVRLYARARAEANQPVEHREAALSRLLDFYLATARGVYARSRPGDRVVDHVAATRHEGLAFATQEAASDWLLAEAEGLLALVHQSLGGAWQRQAVDLLTVSKDLVESGAATSAFHRAALACRDAARTTGDARAEGRACLLLTLSYRLLNRLDDADEASRQALALATSANDPIPRCEAHTDRGIVAVYQHRYDDAERHFRAALAAFRADDNLPGVANSLSNMSRVYAATGRAEEALALLDESITLHERSGGVLRVANSWYAMGIALTQIGRHEEATGYLNRAMECFHSHRQRLWEGSTHARLAEVRLAQQQPAEAVHHAERALELRCIGGERRWATTLTTLGLALAELGQTDRARVCWSAALAVHERLDSPEQQDVRRLLDSLARPAAPHAAPVSS
ncbi:BTAD domain-containing putative transcriptional regulator [Streptomyces buecherae]|uniref:AfsR/SARP family transcriptional regulator n=1 Tax=Streptomyces buecherae TaxID=2763006 RepID=UPI0036999A93